MAIFFHWFKYAKEDVPLANTFGAGSFGPVFVRIVNT
jgi:hypothetical protein